ncbi:glycine cleavage T C-terminal barrel domain-containing protein [Hyphococcus luteus]|uniref:Glycine cleavage system protein T n=1 Tax=Hyphococcus luteus TaxID=2058213 RepID=A0A2S7K455_9PROT|nr:glycine cleavage T C-terminal barrel domain-containing protein [Marinicaulis flavus]PQA87294.1 glycine cleavage system protein T [Marinicaulis flavus]
MTSNSSSVGFGAQIRQSPYFDATLRWGAKGFSVYNHMYIPRSFGDPVENFWNLVERAILCDVAAERQVEITGPDAAAFVQLLTPRNLSKCKVGQCKYVLLTSQEGGIINDPVLLRLGENHFWLSLADSDGLLWAKGVAAYAGMNVDIREPDVSPLQLQGPRSLDIMKALFGDDIETLKYYWLIETELDGIPLVVSRTGWSSERGYEIYLRDHRMGDRLWEIIMAAGEPFGLKPGHTSTIRRIEGAMLSYHADMDIDANPFELGLDRLVDLEMEAPFIGKDALKAIKARGVSRLFVGFEIDGPPLAGPNDKHWPLTAKDETVGHITSAVYSPRLEKNIALGLVDISHSTKGAELTTACEAGERKATVVEKPFYDPKKKLASA